MVTMRMIINALVFTVLASVISPSVQIDCYSCAVGAENCADPFVQSVDRTSTVSCASDICTKKKTVIDGVQKVERGCSMSYSVATKCDIEKTEKGYTALCYCDGQLCNTSTKLMSTVLPLIFCIVTSMVLK